ncbi:MAG: hypothetical protein QXK94_10190 [Candidatus Jordarchaeales archaeon]
MKKFKLTIELVPTPLWFSSLYNLYRNAGIPEEWRRIKAELFRKEGRKCWICGREDRRLEAHEFWEYDDERHVQRLVAIHHLCDLCHKVKHIGFWCYTEEGRRRLRSEGLSEEHLIEHFCRVNNCSREEFEKHKNEAFRVWMERNMHSWTQDLGEYDPEKRRARLRGREPSSKTPTKMPL